MSLEDINLIERTKAYFKKNKPETCPVCGEFYTYLYGKTVGCNKCVGEPWTDTDGEF